MRGRRTFSRRITRALGTVGAVSALALSGLLVTAAPAQAHTEQVRALANCWGSYTIVPDGSFIRASATTNCDVQASQMGVTVTIRERSPQGTVWNCGNPDTRTAVFATTVTATANSCISGGAGWTYWAYSSNWAYVGGQLIEFNSGNWDG